MPDTQHADNQHEELLELIREINNKLDPIWETYRAWETIGRWGKAFLYVAGAVLGIMIAAKQLFR